MLAMLQAVLDSFLRAVIRFWDNRFLRDDEVDYLRDRNAELLKIVLQTMPKTALGIEPETDSIDAEFKNLGKPIETTLQRRRRLERDSLTEWNRLVEEAKEERVSAARKPTEELEAEVLKEN
jgi:hypothetical protein